MTAISTMRLLIPACGCGKLAKEITVDRVAYYRWHGGALIQDCFPELSAEDRERLISGTCGDCWVEMFPEESEDA